MLQRGDKVLPTTWAYRYKLNPEGSIKECRSRLCVRGDRETHEFAKYSAMVSLPILRTLISLLGAGTFKHCACFDIGNAFASTPAKRRCIIDQPTGYWDGSTDVLMLLRVLYGQSDAGRSFWLHLEETLLQEYTRSDADPCTFFKGSLAAGTLIVISTHVDDGPIFAQKES
ncbi:RNA-dependent DNA polymerase [Pycnococcus provasolii]